MLHQLQLKFTREWKKFIFIFSLIKLMHFAIFYTLYVCLWVGITLIKQIYFAIFFGICFVCELYITQQKTTGSFFCPIFNKWDRWRRVGEEGGRGTREAHSCGVWRLSGPLLIAAAKWRGSCDKASSYRTE